jgi:hypothetical protein
MKARMILSSWKPVAIESWTAERKPWRACRHDEEATPIAQRVL